MMKRNEIFEHGDVPAEYDSDEKGHVRSLEKIGGVILASYDPYPTAKPEIADDFHELSRLQKTTECIRYSLAKWLYVLSPSGNLQAWWRLIFRVFLAVFFLFLAIYPVAVLVAMILFHVELAARSLFWIAIYVVGAVLLIRFLIESFSKKR